ncbi:hypothetical protein OIV83_002983 [Microbotryomycetes sp. JL201]|nr:hypothetical protein OIV83_002983 [Microbotryomycetes sp. JL201]
MSSVIGLIEPETPVRQTLPPSSNSSSDSIRPVKKKRAPTFEFSCRPDDGRTQLGLAVAAPLLPSLPIFQGPRPMLRSVSMVRTTGVVNMNMFTKHAFDDEDEERPKVGLGLLPSAPATTTVPWTMLDEKDVHPDHLRESPFDSVESETDSEDDQGYCSTPPSSPHPVHDPNRPKRQPLSPTTDQRFAQLQIQPVKKDQFAIESKSAIVCQVEKQAVGAAEVGMGQRRPRVVA